MPKYMKIKTIGGNAYIQSIPDLSEALNSEIDVAEIIQFIHGDSTK